MECRTSIVDLLLNGADDDYRVDLVADILWCLNLEKHSDEVELNIARREVDARGELLSQMRVILEDYRQTGPFVGLGFRHYALCVTKHRLYDHRCSRCSTWQSNELCISCESQVTNES